MSVGILGTARIEPSKILGLVAGEDASAKAAAPSLAADIGFDALDAGPLNSARYMEALALMNIRLASDLKMGDKIGFALVR